MSDKFDLVVIGGGPGGYMAAIRGAQLGAKVALIEKDQLGGVCLNRGCIPTKAILACTALYEKIQKADNYGISVENSSINLAKVSERKNKIVAKIVRGVEQLMQKNGIELIRGVGQLEKSGLVIIGNREIQAKATILALGSSPTPLPNIPFDHQQFLDSDDALDLISVPKKLDIVGGGVIGLHFAVIFNALGSQVTIHELLPEILPGLDGEIVAAIKRILVRSGIQIKTGTRFQVADSCGQTLICIGRTPNGQYQVNEKLETTLPGIYAVGDLVSSKKLAHVAFEQGVIAAENALGGNRSFADTYVPITIYTHPEIGAVGYTEKEAREKFGTIKTGKFPYAALGIAQAMGEIEGFIKVVTRENGELLGVHILGAEAAALVGAATLALKNHLTVEQLASTFQAHPSCAEGLQEAALSSLARSLHINN